MGPRGDTQTHRHWSVCECVSLPMMMITLRLAGYCHPVEGRGNHHKTGGRDKSVCNNQLIMLGPVGYYSLKPFAWCLNQLKYCTHYATLQ